MPTIINIQKRKKRILNFVREVKDDKMLVRIENVISESINALSPQRKPFTKEELVEGVDKAEKDFEEGRCFTPNQVKSNIGL